MNSPSPSSGTDPFDAIVVGAGPAGSAAATVLARAGRRVLMLEKDNFPRPKVCGEFVSFDAQPSLDRLGVREAVERAAPERIERGSLHLPRGCSVSFRLPAPAYGISRFLLDDLLARRAAGAGAHTRFGARVLSILEEGRGGFRVRFAFEQTEQEARSRFVVGSWGRWDALDRKLERGFLRRGSPYLGWSRDYVGDTEGLAGEVRLYLFPGGYCGLSRVEGGAVNLAGVISEKVCRSRSAGWEGILSHIRGLNPALDADLSPLIAGPTGFLGTGPVYFTVKPPVEAGMLMAGDAAGVIDPFSGTGQAAALASGILAADTIEKALSGDFPDADAAQRYARAWKRSFARRFTWSSTFRILMLNPRLARLAAATLGSERLTRLALRSLRT